MRCVQVTPEGEPQFTEVSVRIGSDPFRKSLDNLAAALQVVQAELLRQEAVLPRHHDQVEPERCLNLD